MYPHAFVFLALIFVLIDLKLAHDLIKNEQKRVSRRKLARTNVKTGRFFHVVRKKYVQQWLYAFECGQEYGSDCEYRKKLHEWALNGGKLA